MIKDQQELYEKYTRLPNWHINEIMKSFNTSAPLTHALGIIIVNKPKRQDEYCKVVDDEIWSLMRRSTFEVVPMKSVADKNLLPGTCYFKYKGKTDWTIRKFKAYYCMRGYIQKRHYTEHLNIYSPFNQRDTARLIFILNYIIDLQSQSIDTRNEFSQEYIPSGEPLFIELTRDIKVIEDSVVLLSY